TRSRTRRPTPPRTPMCWTWWSVRNRSSSKRPQPPIRKGRLAAPFSFVWLLSAVSPQRRVERIGAVQRRFGQHVTLHRTQRIGGAEVALHRQAGEVQGEQAEEVAVQALVVERRIRAVIPAVGAAHLRIAGKPAGVVVQALAGTGRAGRLRLAMRGEAVAAAA